MDNAHLIVSTDAQVRWVVKNESLETFQTWWLFTKKKKMKYTIMGEFCPRDVCALGGWVSL